jgi:hypothetical protein
MKQLLFLKYFLESRSFKLTKLKKIWKNILTFRLRMNTAMPMTATRASNVTTDPRVAMTGTLTVTVGAPSSTPGKTTDMLTIGCTSLTSGTGGMVVDVIVVVSGDTVVGA